MASKAKYLIIDKFFELIEKEDYAKISVTHLVESCNISRQTFYYHFDDIKDMLQTVFNEETEKICKLVRADSWQGSAALYVEFLDKLDLTLRKMSKTEDFVFAYNLIYGTFYSYIKAYASIKKSPLAKDDSDFVISYSASAIAGLVVLELQKDKSDYKTILEKLTKGFTSIKK